MLRPFVFLLFCALAAPAAPKRVLYMTHSAGFRHASLPTSCAVMQDLGVRSGAFEVTCSEDLALISADSLQGFDILYFFTSGELALSDQQKADMLAFVRDGKGFGGAHSATDTFYTWPGYYMDWNGVDSLPLLQETPAVKNFIFRKPGSVAQYWLHQGIGCSLKRQHGRILAVDGSRDRIGYVSTIRHPFLQAWKVNCCSILCSAKHVAVLT